MSEIDPVAAAAAAALPEDVVAEILVLVRDVVSLFRCSVVCKRWRGLVADPAFLRRLWPEGGGRPSLLGFFAQRHRKNGGAQRKVSRLFPSRAPVFIPAPDSVLGPGRRFLNSFIRDDAGVLDEAKPLAARGGLLLVRVAPRSSDTNGVLRLCVCNLLTGRCECLPPLDVSLLDNEGVKGYALITAADLDAEPPHRLADGYSTLFQVLLIAFAHQNNNQLHVLKFSSSAAADGSARCWSLEQAGVQISGASCCSAAIAGGTAHWLFRSNVYTNLHVSINTGHISTTRLPFGRLPSDAWLCNIDARLSILGFVHNQLHILSPRYEDDVNLEWPTSHFPVSVDKGLVGESLSIFCAGENSHTALALYHSNPEVAYMLDFQSGAATKVAGWTRLFNYMTVVPCEINWPMFLMSRLGVQI